MIEKPPKFKAGTISTTTLKDNINLRFLPFTLDMERLCGVTILRTV